MSFSVVKVLSKITLNLWINCFELLDKLMPNYNELFDAWTNADFLTVRWSSTVRQLVPNSIFFQMDSIF